ncbi:MAG: S1 RNA-binding domain-containing protein, partial [Candidatus Sulfotelmatobacter sp.]
MLDETTVHDTTANDSTSTATAVSEAEPTAAETQHTESHDTQPQTESHDDGAATSDEKAAAGEDFASVLENFTTEAEEAVSEDRVIKGTVLKLTATHVVVDIGAKSEGMLALSEVLDHEGKPKFKPGDEIDVMRDKGQAEEGYIHLSHQKAQRIHAWEEIEKAHNDKKSIKAVVIDRIKGGLTVDIMGAHAFLPGSQVDLRPIRNLDGMKGQTIEVSIIKLNKKRGNIVVSRKELLEGEQNEKRSKTLEHLEEGSIL